MHFKVLESARAYVPGWSGFTIYDPNSCGFVIHETAVIFEYGI
jgi:hypothetical protein